MDCDNSNRDHTDCDSSNRDHTDCDCNSLGHNHFNKPGFSTSAVSSTMRRDPPIDDAAGRWPGAPVSPVSADAIRDS